MKVECIKKISATTGEEVNGETLLTIGRIYIVLAVHAAPKKEVKFRIIGDDGRTPALFDSRQFKVVDQSVSSTWIVQVNELGIFKLGPKKWMRSGFWEDYFNDLSDAIKDFEEEKTKIMTEG